MLFMIWPCNGQVFFNEIDCYIFILFIYTRHRKFRHRKTRHRKLGPSPSPASLFFSVSCLKRFPDTPRIYTMVLQGFISIVSLSPLLSNLHRRILRSAIIACALQKKMVLLDVLSYFVTKNMSFGVGIIVFIQNHSGLPFKPFTLKGLVTHHFPCTLIVPLKFDHLSHSNELRSSRTVPWLGRVMSDGSYDRSSACFSPVFSNTVLYIWHHMYSTAYWGILITLQMHVYIYTYIIYNQVALSCYTISKDIITPFTSYHITLHGITSHHRHNDMI